MSYQRFVFRDFETAPATVATNATLGAAALETSQLSQVSQGVFPSEAAAGSESVANVATVAGVEVRRVPCPSTAADAFEERAAILEFDAGRTRAAAEDEAAREKGHADRKAYRRWLAGEYERGLLILRRSGLCASGAAYVETGLQFVRSGWAERALAAGWGDHELFRADENFPWQRIERLGAGFLAADPIGVTAEYIDLEPAGREPRRIPRCRGDGYGCWPWHSVRAANGGDRGDNHINADRFASVARPER